MMIFRFFESKFGKYILTFDMNGNGLFSALLAMDFDVFTGHEQCFAILTNFGVWSFLRRR